jgi:hypothetical protein
VAEKVVHVIPVPRHMTAEQAWEEIRLLGCLLPDNQPKDDDDCSWAVVVEVAE